MELKQGGNIYNETFEKKKYVHRPIGLKTWIRAEYGATCCAHERYYHPSMWWRKRFRQQGSIWSQHWHDLTNAFRRFRLLCLKVIACCSLMVFKYADDRNVQINKFSTSCQNSFL